MSMDMQRFTLIDSSSGDYAADAVIDASSPGLKPAAHGWSVCMRRLHGGPSDGIDVVNLDNGHLQLAILPTRGMGIWKGRCGNIPLQWHSPVGHPVHPSLVDQSRRGGIGWLDGFNELICRCGLAWNGAPGTDTIRDANGNIISEQFLPLHGRIANLIAHEVHVEIYHADTIRLIGVVDETGMFGERFRLTSVLSTVTGSSQFEIRDTVTNLGGRPAEMEMLYHCNFGRPVLGEGATFHTAATRVAPRDARAAEDVGTWKTFTGPTVGYAEQVYFVSPVSDSFGRGHAVLRSSDGTSAIAVDFDTATLPWFSLWKNTQEEAGGYVCGLEPGSGLPNNRNFERQQGRVISLEPGQSTEFSVSFTIAESKKQAAAMIREVESLQRDTYCSVESYPVSDLSPIG